MGIEGRLPAIVGSPRGSNPEETRHENTLGLPICRSHQTPQTGVHEELARPRSFPAFSRLRVLVVPEVTVRYYYRSGETER
jgi:hypothetical protein